MKYKKNFSPEKQKELTAKSALKILFNKVYFTVTFSQFSVFISSGANRTLLSRNCKSEEDFAKKHTCSHFLNVLFNTLIFL